MQTKEIKNPSIYPFIPESEKALLSTTGSDRIVSWVTRGLRSGFISMNWSTRSAIREPMVLKYRSFTVSNKKIPVDTLHELVR